MKKLIIMPIIALISFTAHAESVNYLCQVSKASYAFLKKDAPYHLVVERQGSSAVGVTLFLGAKKLVAHSDASSKVELVSSHNDFYTRALRVDVALTASLVAGYRTGSIFLTPEWSGNEALSDVLSCSMLDR